ncbi:MAG: hypothetical protein KC933_15680 [Myxococcales bacterium]|nr:hypothetical protein [Myxococcales bacterium]MCB9651790.1 hypothetical protein [Deltaproteobacteria bacterium]
MDQFYGIGLLVAWVLLQAWILPKLGIPTCMSGACAVPRNRALPKKTTEEPGAEA